MIISYGSGNSLKDPASKAYAQVFAPHHGWAIRKAVGAGMYALPTKAQLLQKLNEDGEFMKQFEQLFVLFYFKCMPVHMLLVFESIF